MLCASQDDNNQKELPDLSVTLHVPLLDLSHPLISPHVLLLRSPIKAHLLCNDHPNTYVRNLILP